MSGLFHNGRKLKKRWQFSRKKPTCDVKNSLEEMTDSDSEKSLCSASNSPPPLKTLIPVAVIDEYRLDEDRCEYHVPDTSTWVDPFCLRWPVVRQFWLARQGVDKQPRQPVLRHQPASKKQKPKPAEPGLLTLPEDEVEIVGIVNNGGILKIALKLPGDSRLSIISSQEVRNRFPVQLSQYYEKHIHFL
jgi:hypothetical protein